MSPDAALAAHAACHHGVITREVAHLCGLSDAAIRHRVRTGRWIRMGPGVYVVAGSVATFRRRVMVGVSAAPDSVASHATAARLHRMTSLPADHRVHVTTSSTSSGRSRLAVVHRSRDLAAIDVTIIEGIPVTTVARTILDLGSCVHGPRLGEVIDDALDAHLVTREQLADCASRHALRGRPGMGKVRAALVARGDGLAVTESTFERRFVAFCAARSFSAPLLQVTLHWRDRVFGRADTLFADAQVIVELDGRLGHSQLTDIEHDKVRMQEAAAAGWQTLEVTWDQLHRHPDELEERLRAVLAGRAAIAER